ncbi:MAG: GAF domain-containing protein [Anaerolineales bacterium]|nr:GAF domain-containing protein [Anaerolineales bacterium]
MSSDRQEITTFKYDQRLLFLQHISQAMLHSHKPVEIAQATLNHLAQMFSFSRGSFVMFDHEAQEFIILAIKETVETALKTGSRYSLHLYPDLSHLQKGEVFQQSIEATSDFINTELAQAGIQTIINVPIRVQNKLIGAINIGRVEKEMFSEVETAVLLEMVNALAAALQQAHLLVQERNQRELAQTLHDISRALNSSLELEQVLDIILEQLAHIVPYDSASIMLRERHLLRNVAHRSIYQHKVRFSELHIANFLHIQELFATHTPQIISDTTTDPRWQAPTIASSIRSWLGVPLILHEDTIGLLNISKSEPNFYKEQDVETAVIFATQAVNAIENARLFTSERQARKMAETLQGANVALTQSLDLDTILDTLLTYVHKLISYDSVSILLLSEDRTAITIHMGKGYETYSQTPLSQSTIFKLDQTPNLKQLTESQKGMIIDDTQQYEGWIPTPHSHHIRNWLGVPLIVGGEIIGLFSLDKCEPYFFTESHLRACESLAAQAAIAIQNASLFHQSRSRAKELELLSDLSKRLRLAPHINEMLHIILESATVVVNIDTGMIYLLDADENQFMLRYSLPQPQHSAASVNNTNLHTTVPLVLIPHPEHDAKNMSIRISNDERGNQIHIPLQTQEQTVGFMVLNLRLAQILTPGQKRLLTAIADIAGSALQRALILETLEQRVEARTHELALANEQLRELDRLKTKFVADISHELRTPLTNIRLYLDLFSKGSPEKREHYFTILKEQSQRLSTLVEDILSLSRFDVPSNHASHAELNINQIVTAIVQNYSPAIQQQNNIVSLALDNNPPQIHGILQHIERAISNLLTNAINHTSNGEISVFTLHDEDWLYLKIQDTGPGISEEDLPHLFERFYRGSKTSQSTTPGTGLGLAIVKEIMLIHNGDVYVESELGQGAVFTLKFPVT